MSSSCRGRPCRIARPSASASASAGPRSPGARCARWSLSTASESAAASTSVKTRRNRRGASPKDFRSVLRCHRQHKVGLLDVASGEPARREATTVDPHALQRLRGELAHRTAGKSPSSGAADWNAPRVTQRDSTQSRRPHQQVDARVPGTIITVRDDRGQRAGAVFTLEEAAEPAGHGWRGPQVRAWTSFCAASRPRARSVSVASTASASRRSSCLRSVEEKSLSTKSAGSWRPGGRPMPTRTRR
jgi:hypothetical protein